MESIYVMEFLHSCWTPTVQCSPRFFYPFGNTKMEDLLEDFKLGDQVDVLLLGIGDIRHILKTVGGVSVRADRVDGTPPPLSIRLVINDCDAALIARDILLLKIVSDIDGRKVQDIEFLWDVWYNSTLLKSHHQRLKETLRALIRDSATDLWTYGNVQTKQSVVRILTLWLKDIDNERSENNNSMCMPSLLLYTDSDYCLEEKECRYFDEWMSYEKDKSARNTRKTVSKDDVRYNSTMSRPREKIDSTAAFDIKPWYSYFPMDRMFLDKFNSMYEACMSVLQSLVISFQATVKMCTVSIVVWLEDALKLCHLRLPVEDTFDLVFTSNLSDYLGLVNVILACAPRLKRKNSVLITEVFRWPYQFSTLESYIAAHLGCGPMLFPSIYGVRLAEDLEMGSRSVKTTPSI